MARTLSIAGLLILTFGLGWFANNYSASRSGQSKQIRDKSTDYSFIRPILFLDNSELNFPELDPLKNKVSFYIDEALSKGLASNVGFYYRDLGTAKWTGVNEDSKFAPSSLLKVSTLIAYLKLAQKDSAILLQKAPYQPRVDSGQHYKPARHLKPGEYTYRELLQQMVIESDNEAMDALDRGRIDDVLDVYEDLQLPNPIYQPQDFLSPREYSRILRTLYNSSYLSHLYSDEALKLLSYTNFNKGIVAGIASTTVAHKFGEQTLMENGKLISRELHNCGIVYDPRKPYLICVMTKGKEFADLEKVIAGISRIVYENIQDAP